MLPSYFSLSEKEWQKRIEKLFKILEKCKLCPRKCGVNRIKGEEGFCKLKFLPKVSAYHPHFGEEKVLVGRYGSGTIFLTSCNLSCVYCQNYEISQLRIGEEISFERLAQMMLELQKMGCHNINFVTPTPQVPQIVKAVYLAVKKGLKIPLVYNTNAYDSVEVLKLLEGIFDIYLPDAKYSDNEIALRYSQALYPPKFCEAKFGRAGYFETMKKVIKEMHRQVGDLKINEEDIVFKGLLVRHLVLPNNLAGSEKIFKFLAEEISKDTFLNIMDQYWPAYRASEFKELSRRITQEEFKKALSLAQKFGLRRIYF